MSPCLSPHRDPGPALLAASLLVTLTALAYPASASYLPEWAQSVASTFCRNVQAGLEPRQSMRRALEEHRVSLVTPAVADLNATTRTVAFAVLERCPEAMEALRSGATTRTAPRGGGPQGGAPAGGGSSGACSSYILVGGRRQCI
jgi:hypothetical protein